MKIGLMLGSFNPIHVGHLIIANTVLNLTDLDEIWLVISPMSPDKQNMDLLHHNERYRIVKDALKNEGKLHACDIEFDMDQPNYTYKTLDRLREKYPKNEFGVIMGSDNANNLKQWVGIEYWQKNHKLYIVERPNNYLEHNVLNWYGEENWELIKVPEMGISSTIIREKVRRGESIKYLVPSEIINRIEFNYGTKEKT